LELPTAFGSRRAGDQDSMELAQKLAAQSIMRLAGLRSIASVSASR
jgi:hypothetical protein